MKSTKVGKNGGIISFTPKCHDIIEYGDYIKPWNADFNLCCVAGNKFRLVTFNPNEVIDSHYLDELWINVNKERERELSKGIKESEGKLMTTELDSRFTKEMAKVMTINKAKYPRGNKYKKLDPIELFEAMERHLLAVKEHFQYNTSLIDDDGCNHIAKIATNADMLFVQLNLITNENK